MTNNPSDDLKNFDDSQYSDLESAMDEPYEEPLPDDLSDDLGIEDDMPQDEDFETDDNWDDQAADMQNDSQPQEKKKSYFLTYAIIGAVVIGGGAFALSQFGGGATAPQTTETAIDNNMAETSLEGLRDEASEQAALEPVQTDPVAVPVPAEAPQGFMNETPSLPPGPSLTAVDASSETAPPAAALPDVPEAPPVVPANDPAVITGLKPISDFPSVEQIKKSEPAPLDAPPVVADAVPAVVEAPAMPNTAELTVMQGKLDAAQSKIEALEKELEAAKSSTADTSSGEAVITELEGKVASLEQKLSERDSELMRVKKAAERPQTSATPTEPDISEEEPLQTEVSAPSAAPAPVKPVAVAWELRGAQPGKVLLSRKGMGGDVRTVSLGDTVPGLGKIVSIDRTASGWVVKGTQGSVSQ